jgi:hypothetical protein
VLNFKRPDEVTRAPYKWLKESSRTCPEPPTRDGAFEQELTAALRKGTSAGGTIAKGGRLRILRAGIKFANVTVCNGLGKYTLRSGGETAGSEPGKIWEV